MNERLQGVLKSPWTIPVAVGVTAFGGGLGLGYILWGRKTDFERMEDEQLTFDYKAFEAAKERAGFIVDEEVYHSPATAPETDVDVADDVVIVRSAEPIEEDIPYQHGVDGPEEPEPEVELITRNVFEDEDWDWEEEIAGRNAMTEPAPYIIHRDEFYRNEMELTQLTLRYFKGDRVMVDEDDSPIHNYPAIVGPLNFGHGANTSDRFYVRNEERKGEYEIIEEEGHYSVEILGLEAERAAEDQDLRHSHQIGRFRMD